MPTPSRSRTLASLLAVCGLLALAASPVAAKEGAIAKLDTAIHRDAEPGSTIQVGWSVFMIAADGEHPVYGSPIYVKLVGPDGSSTREAGTEKPAGSGHYVASIVVPAGGIDQVIVAMAGSVCYEGGACERSDYVFPLTDDGLVTGKPAGITQPASPASTATGSVGNALAPLIAVGVAIALAGGLAALIVTRRRQVGIEPSGR